VADDAIINDSDHGEEYKRIYPSSAPWDQWGRYTVAKCPKCGKDNAKPTKTWKMAPKGKKPIVIGLHKCASCGMTYRISMK
jgi:hypothetical protein